MAPAKPKKAGNGGLLHGARVYLSGPMDFVANREDEKTNGWRARIGNVLRDLGAIVFDPWNKPEVRGLHEYGKEGVDTDKDREKWTFENSTDGAKTRAKMTGHYWETLHIDLRMVDTADFLVAHCPTNVYSVGTVHEIALARLERPKRPLLPALVELSHRLPQKWDDRLKKYVRNDDWLLWDIHDNKIEQPHGES